MLSLRPMGCSNRSGIADRIDHVQITAAETVGVERRGKFYRRPGHCAHGPDHVFTLLQWWRWTADRVRRGRDPPPKRPKCRRDARHRSGTGGARPVRSRHDTGKKVRPIRQEPDVAADPTPRLCRHAARDRQLALGRPWPFYIRTGKHMSQRKTEIAIRFKQAPLRGIPGHARRHPAAQLAGFAHRAG